MRFSYHIILLLILLSFILLACEQGVSGNEFENQPPSTSLTVNEINLPEGQRLSSRINISWSGTDPDGFIEGFEFAIGDTTEGAFTFTSATDSIFILPITSGQSVDDVAFKIRAVDNDGARDPIGASLIYPIVNTPPVVEFNLNELPPDTTYTFASIGWTVGDPDGIVSLQSTEISFNDSSDTANWLDVPLPNEDADGRIFLTFDIDNDAATAEAQIFNGRGFGSTQMTIGNILVGQENTIYVRTIDQSGAVSELDAHTWFIKRQNSRILLLNDDDSPSSPDVQAFHLQLLADNGLTPDILDISDGQATAGNKVRISSAFPSVIDPTLRRALAKWDHIYWISNNLDRNITFAQEITAQFISNGGTIFITIPTKEIPITDPLFNFIPVGDIARPEGAQNSFRISRNAEIFSQSDPSLPVLRATRTISNIFPIDGAAGSENIYEADFRAQLITGQIVDYNGFESVAVQNSEANLIYYGLDLSLVNGNNNVSELIQRLCVQALGFQQ